MTINHHLVRSLIRQSCPVKATTSKSILCPFSSQISTNRSKPYESIPGPKPLPLIGNTWRYLPLIGEYDLENTPENLQDYLDKYGSLVRESLFGSFSILHVFDPVDMGSVFRSEGKYPNRRTHRALLKYRHDRPEIYSSGGMFPENGAAWYHLRKLIQTIMLNQSRINQFIPTISSTSDQMVSNICQLRNSNGTIDDLMPQLYKWALETNGSVFVGQRFGCLDLNGSNEGEDLIHAIHETHEAVLKTELAATNLWQYFPTSDYKRLVNSQDIMGAIVSKYVDNLRKCSSKYSSDGSQSVGSQLLEQPEASARDVFTIIMDLFLASFDTTAFVVGFTLYHLACHQQCQDQIRNELNKLLPNKNDPINEETLRQMKYLKACVKESLRINPFSIGTGRVANKDLTIRDYNVPEGTMIIIQNQVACVQESNFPQPKQFIPERWLDEKKKSSPFTILPFGYGARMCIGRRLSELEIYLLVAKMIRNYRIEYDHYEPFRAKTRFINVPVGPLKLRFIDLPN
uniref:Cyp302a1 n=1 Tax=Eotetranychus kankitus TaxID=2137873 RepID=A0A5P9NYG1_9ACAR|nr:cyp302a1 [Eotetranychus kankitus]